MSDTVNECPLTMLSHGGLQRLHLADDDAISWLEQTAMKELTMGRLQGGCHGVSCITRSSTTLSEPASSRL